MWEGERNGDSEPGNMHDTDLIHRRRRNAGWNFYMQTTAKTGWAKRLDFDRICPAIFIV